MNNTSYHLTSLVYRVSRLIDDLAGVRRQPAAVAPVIDVAVQPQMKAETDQLQSHLLKYFQQWVNIFQRSSSPEKTFIPYITQLTKQGILKAEDVSSFFFRVCAESSVGHYSKCFATNDLAHAFQALDAMSRLIVLIIKYHGDASGTNNDQAKVHYLTKILSIVVLVLASRHEEQGVAFQQKPFFRFFSSLLSDLHTIESSLGQTYFNLLIVIRLVSIHRVYDLDLTVSLQRYVQLSAADVLPWICFLVDDLDLSSSLHAEVVDVGEP